MPTRDRPVDRGTRLGRMDLIRTGVEIRAARVAAGLSLREVGRAVGLSAAQLSRFERGFATGTSVIQTARIGAVVGLDVRLRTHPGMDPLRDAGQVRLLARLWPRLDPRLRVRTEVPLPIPGDQRSWDGWISGLQAGDGSVAGLPVEAETRFVDAQAQLRRLHLKMRDGAAESVLLIIADTRANRASVDAAGMVMTESFPISPRRALAALRAGRHPGGSAVVFL